MTNVDLTLDNSILKTTSERLTSLELPTFDGLSSLNVDDIQHYICEFLRKRKIQSLYLFLEAKFTIYGSEKIVASDFIFLMAFNQLN